MMTLAEIFTELEKMSLSEKQIIFNALEVDLMLESDKSEVETLERISETIIKDRGDG